MTRRQRRRTRRIVEAPDAIIVPPTDQHDRHSIAYDTQDSQSSDSPPSASSSDDEAALGNSILHHVNLLAMFSMISVDKHSRDCLASILPHIPQSEQEALSRRMAIKIKRNMDANGMPGKRGRALVLTVAEQHSDNAAGDEDVTTFRFRLITDKRTLLPPPPPPHQTPPKVTQDAVQAPTGS